MLYHITLASYYRMMFSLMQHHKYTKQDLDEMLPFERDLFYSMLVEYLKELEQEREKNRNR